MRESEKAQVPNETRRAQPWNELSHPRSEEDEEIFNDVQVLWNTSMNEPEQHTDAD